MNSIHKQFFESHRVVRLATVGADGIPHVTPVCFAMTEDTVYITIDQKPKRGQAKPLQRLRNIAANATVALVADHYEENWSELGWVMLRGEARVLEDGEEHDYAQSILKSRYPQYRDMHLAPLPVIAIRVVRSTAWGKLE